MSAQQPKRGAAIQWGIYTAPKFKAAHFVIAVYAGGVKIDAKNQYYEPHASVPATKAAKYAGKDLVISGTITSGGDEVFVRFTCKIA